MWCKSHKFHLFIILSVLVSTDCCSNVKYTSCWLESPTVDHPISSHFKRCTVGAPLFASVEPMVWTNIRDCGICAIYDYPFTLWSLCGKDSSSKIIMENRPFQCRRSRLFSWKLFLSHQRDLYSLSSLGRIFTKNLFFSLFNRSAKCVITSKSSVSK